MLSRCYSGSAYHFCLIYKKNVPLLLTPISPTCKLWSHQPCFIVRSDLSCTKSNGLISILSRSHELILPELMIKSTSGALTFIELVNWSNIYTLSEVNG